MSESGELDSGPSDKEGEKDKDSKVENNEKEEGKSDEASVVNKEVNEKKIVRTSGDKKVDFDSPSNKKLKQSKVPQAKSGDRSKRPIEEVQLYTDPNEPISDSDSEFDTDDDSYWPDEVFLFEMEVPSTNRLVIPYELASNYFPPLATRKPTEKQVETLEFTDSLNNEWYMPIQYYRDERGFMILSGWQQFSTQYDLQPMDVIRIFEPVPRLHSQHFLIEAVKKQGTVEMPEFRQENFLFQIELERSDVEFRRVFLERDDVRNFPGVKMQRNSRERKNKKIMRFTDDKCKDWYMTIVRYSENKYMVMDGWSEFVKERGLEVGDVIGFFKHERPCHRKHYLIGIVKKEGGGNPGQPGGGNVVGPGGPSRLGGGSGSARGGSGRMAVAVVIRGRK